jgi:hypothetical protein
LLRDRINSSTYDMPVAVDELLNLADAIVDTPPATMAGLLAIVEVAQHDLMRQGEEDSVAARALAAIGRTLLATSASAWSSRQVRGRRFILMYANGHTGLAAVARLQRIGAALAAGEAPDREDARWLAGCFDRYFLEAAAGVDLDAALGLTQPPGVAAWWHARRHAERDSLLRQAAGQYSGSTNAKAIQLQQRLKRYAATSWPRDRASRQPSVWIGAEAGPTPLWP